MRKAGIEISAEDKTKSAFNSSLHNLANFVHVARGAIDVFKQFGAALLSGIKTAMGFQAAARPFERFVGSVADAEKHLKDLQSIGAKGVIPTDQLIEASRSLMQLSNGAVGSASDMARLADVAATTGEPINGVSDAVGNLIQRLAAGDNIDRAVRDLERMGIVTPDVAAEMRELSRDAENAGDVFDLLTREVDKFSGGVEADSKTAAAAVEGMNEQWRLALGEAGAAFLDLTSNQVGGLADKIQDLRDSGIIEEWAQNVVSAIEWMLPVLSKAGDFFGGIADGLRNTAARAGAFVGAMQGGAGIGAAWEISGQIQAQMADERKKERALAQVRRDERRKAAREDRDAQTDGGFAEGGAQRAQIVAQAAQREERKATDARLKEHEKYLKAKERMTRESARNEQRAIQDEIRSALARAASASDRAGVLRGQALDPVARRAARDAERDTAREQRRFDGLIEKGNRGLDSSSIRAAFQSLAAEQEAAQEVQRAAELEQRAIEIAEASEKHLEQIQKQTAALPGLLKLRES